MQGNETWIWIVIGVIGQSMGVFVYLGNLYLIKSGWRQAEV
jgi:lipid-A-disaccharide synthase-like uncharacterized protein